MQDMRLESESAHRPLQIFRYQLGTCAIGRNEYSNDSRSRDQLVQQLQPLRPQLHVQYAHARDVATRPIQAGDKSNLDRVASGHEYDWNRRGCCLGRLCSRAVCGNHVHSSSNEIGCQFWQPIVSILRKAVFDRHVLAFDIAALFQTSTPGAQKVGVLARSPAAEEPDPRDRRLLRARRQRPRCGTAEKHDDLAPLHSITSSAVNRSFGGTSSPSALAVFKLITSSYLVGC